MRRNEILVEAQAFARQFELIISLELLGELPEEVVAKLPGMEFPHLCELVEELLKTEAERLKKDRRKPRCPRRRRRRLPSGSRK